MFKSNLIIREKRKEIGEMQLAYYIIMKIKNFLNHQLFL